jgi:hypothetical protein
MILVDIEEGESLVVGKRKGFIEVLEPMNLEAPDLIIELCPTI